MPSDLRYPIGPFEATSEISPADLKGYLDRIESTPRRLRAALEGLTPRQLDTPYRPEGWTLRQVVHHLPDSHMNAYVRVKLTLTEDRPKIRPYFEDRWGELEDCREGPIEPSIALLEALHTRWVPVLRALRPDQLERQYEHPEYGKTVSLRTMIATYAWHDDHHIAHITTLREREGW